MAITSLDMTPANFSATNPTMNKRWPPLADKTSLPYRLTSLSRQKLAREATAPNPDIRRCLGHFRLHCSSMEWAQKEMTTRISSFELEDDEEEEEEESEKEKQKQEEKQLSLLGSHDEETKNRIRSRKDDEDEEGAGKKELRVQFHISVTPSTPAPSPTSPAPSQSPAPSSNESSDDTEKTKEKDGILEKGISCLEKTVQRRHFWPTPGQCIPVRLAG